MAVQTPQRYTQTATETRTPACSFLPKLESGELLTGTPTLSVSPTTSPALSATGAARNTATITILGVSHIADQAVQYTVSGGVAGTEYTVRVSCDTDGGQTLEFDNIVTVTS